MTGPDSLRPIIRTLGPSLPLPNKLGDPVLELYDSNGTLLQANDNWAAQEGDIQATGFPPTNNLESVIVTTTVPGSHTVIVRGKKGGSGVVAVEVYGLPDDE